MKVRTTLSLLALGLGTSMIAVSPGCSSSETTGASGGRVPPPAEGPPTASTEERTFAIYELDLGEADRSGNKNKDAWKDYGYNLDGLVTTVTGPDSPDLAKVCTPKVNATIHQDGKDGIDNAFGKTVLPSLDPYAPTPSRMVTNDQIRRGTFTILLKVKGLTDDPSQTNTGLGGTLLIGGDLGRTPTFSQGDDWPFREKPQVSLAGSYVNKGVFVGGTGGGSVQLSLNLQGQALDITINKAIITFKHQPPSDIVDGTIAGVIETEEFVRGIGAIAGSFSRDLCTGTTVDTFKDLVRRASDMLADGTQKAGVPCTGISIGIGFTGKRVANPTKTAPEATGSTDPCAADAGGGDAGAQDSGTQDSGNSDAAADAGADADASQ